MGNSFENLFSDIATIIRSKDGTTASIYPNDFATRITSLSTGYNSSLTITAKDYSSSHYKSSCYITCTTSEGYTDTVYGTFSSSGMVSFTLKYIGTYVFHYTCLDGSTEYNWTKNFSNTQNGLIFNEEIGYCVVDPTKTTLTETEFIQICNGVLQSQMTVGAIITLANSYQTQWEVIGVNHDSTTNTVDIMSHTNINATEFGSSNKYSGSNVQTFCNSTIPNAFTNATTKSLIKTMDVVSNGSTLTGQYGKALSYTEVGGATSSYAVVEGTSYGLSSYLYRSGVKTNVWTRSSYNRSGWLYSDSCWKISSSSISYGLNTTSYGVLPVLRF